ncbi:MAG: DUF134 domain-containing protein [Phycisphaerae bacterium]|nr:DUF134 domain-containing protein [Phycisphaerae bacterium]
MPRPCKNRFISGRPSSVMYKPAGVPMRGLERVSLGLDEFETLRLLDYEGLGQEAVAVLMGISRPTVTRIYASARQKIAEALTEGKVICIEGGPIKDADPRENMPGGPKGCGGGGRRCRGGRGP